MDIEINSNNFSNIDNHNLQKMIFIYNALHNGWEVKKSGEKYIFTKKHNGIKEIYLDNYIDKFIESNLSVKNLDIKE